MDRAAKSFRLSNIGRARESSGSAMNSIAEDVWSERSGEDCDCDDWPTSSLFEDFERFN